MDDSSVRSGKIVWEIEGEPYVVYVALIRQSVEAEILCDGPEEQPSLWARFKRWLGVARDA